MSDDSKPCSQPHASDQRTAHLTLRGRILSIAVIGTLGFTLFLTFMLNDFKENADLLQDIRDIRHPVQKNLVAAYNELEGIDNTLEHAFISLNASLLDHSSILAAQFRVHLHQTMHIEEKHTEDVNRILNQFDTYFNNSHALAQNVISGNLEFNHSTAIKQQNAYAFNNLLDALGDLQSKQSEALVQSVNDATKRASDTVTAGLLTGVVTAVLLFVIAFFTTQSILQRINHMVKSLRKIAIGTGNMGVRMPITGADEMTELAHWFNTFLEKLQCETERSTAEVKRLAFTDTLTNLPNRRMFLKCLDAEIERTNQLDGASFAVLFMDLDNFKPVNDQLGHEAGDELLCAVSQRLVNAVRSTDTISNDLHSGDIDSPQPGRPVVARLAGDEFMMILTNIKSEQQAAGIAERIRLAVMDPYMISGMECSIGLSIGICLYPQHSQDAEDLVASADMAMYEAKNHGKNTYRFFDPELRAATELKVKLDNAIRLAIPNNELHLLYQPQFSLSDHKLVGAEALLRWTHSQLGTFTPGDFIRRAEASGQICELDDWVLNQVLTQLHAWEMAGIEPVCVALNFSAAQAARPQLATAVNRIAGDKKHLLNYIEIEITETSAIDNIAVVEANITALKDLGLKIAMDDFGSGHSSLTLLTRCEIDTLKIDKEVTGEVRNDQKSRDVVQSIIDLAAKLNVSTIAEGIEDEIQARLLAQMNCDVAQGYLFSKPMDTAEFTKYLIAKKGIKDQAA